MENKPEPATDVSEAKVTAPPEPKIKIWKKLTNKKLLIASCVVIIALVVSAGIWLGRSSSPKASTGSVATTSHQVSQVPGATSNNVQGLQLDPNKNYGNKYANGILPVGDNHYQTTGAKVGYPYVCSNYAKNLAVDAGGAGTRGPWFIGTTEYDINKKISVQGSVKWQSQFSDEVSGSTRIITSNNLPPDPTGIFPISPSDPAYAYDKNPNTITAQSFTYDLNSSPTYGNPSCIGGQVGVMLTGVAIFSGFDAGGRDAGAWEVQDSCQGHPESTGVYHYHTLSSCIKNINVKTVIGFALDGFPITGPEVGPNNFLTTSDLDECHGITSQIILDGKTTTMYHYVMTQDFPYSVSCYRGTAIQPPSQHNATQSHTQSGPSGQQSPQSAQPRPRP